MKDINLLIEKLKMVTSAGHSATAFKSVVDDITKFYCDNFELQTDEVAILLTDKDNMVLSFASPEHLSATLSTISLDERVHLALAHMIAICKCRHNI